MENKSPDIIDRMENVFGPQKTFKCLAMGLIGICIGAIFLPNDPKPLSVQPAIQVQQNNKEE